MIPSLRVPLWAGALVLATACSQEPGPLAALGAEGGPPPEERIVLITLDTLRNDSFLGAEGAPGAMPLTRAWAEQGLVFDSYYSCSSATQPAHATLFTGLHPWQNGVSHNGAILDEGHEVLAERLREAGFSTGAAVASYPVHSTFGYAQGFDVFLERFNRGQDWDNWVGRKVTADGGFFASGDLVVEEALHLINGLGGTKQFLWIHLFDAHWPYGDRSDASREETDKPVVHQLAQSPERREEILARARELYDADVAALDGDLARILERLDQDSETRTHIVLVSDHGESLGEANAIGHGMRITEEQLRVPLIVRSPLIDAGLRTDPVGTQDVAGLVLSLAGIADLPEGCLDLAAGEVRDDHRVVGMRSTFSDAIEIRADGSSRRLDPRENVYFQVEGDRLFTGNDQKIRIGDDGEALQASELTARLGLVFAGFESLLSATADGAPLNKDAARALEALGYSGND